MKGVLQSLQPTISERVTVLMSTLTPSLQPRFGHQWIINTCTGIVMRYRLTQSTYEHDNGSNNGPSQVCQFSLVRQTIATSSQAFSISATMRQPTTQPPLGKTDTTGMPAQEGSLVPLAGDQLLKLFISFQRKNNFF